MMIENGYMPREQQAPVATRPGTRFPVPDCRPYYTQWLACVDTKDNCCGANKCRFFFQEWQNCDKYSREVRAHNAKIPRFVDPDSGTYNGLSSR